MNNINIKSAIVGYWRGGASIDQISEATLIRQDVVCSILLEYIQGIQDN